MVENYKHTSQYVYCLYICPTQIVIIIKHKFVIAFRSILLSSMLVVAQKDKQSRTEAIVSSCKISLGHTWHLSTSLLHTDWSSLSILEWKHCLVYGTRIMRKWNIIILNFLKLCEHYVFYSLRSWAIYEIIH